MIIEHLLNYGWWVGALLIIAGFVALVKGADWLVDGASAIAKRFGISDLAIGLTVVAFGTSMPEFVVNMVSVAEGSTDLAITNILGSNIINTFVILGLTAVVYPIASQKRSRDFDIPLSIIAGVLVFAFVAVRSPWGDVMPAGDCGDDRGIGRVGGIVLLAMFVYFLYNTFRHAKDHPGEVQGEDVPSTKAMSAGRAVVLILAGLAGLVIGGELIVKSAVDLATRIGVSEAVIGLTVVALGTSLPELATSVIAATKKNCDIALGNVVGSNIFNVFFILGTSAVIHPLPAYQGIELDAWAAAVGSLLVWLFVKSNQERQIKRWEGGILLLAYAGYLTYRLLNV
ncbi:MAG: calcium/sodium antiporter [Paludibacteraceae bacterium]|nr:calcium/sodium antiporter [Paludibacteraceae bacterium]